MLDPDDDAVDECFDPIPSGPRDTEDDFFCLRYRVWYPSHDCALRTRFQSAPGCLRCDQGRFNLKRHAAAIARVRWPLPRAAPSASTE